MGDSRLRLVRLSRADVIREIGPREDFAEAVRDFRQHRFVPGAPGGDKPIEVTGLTRFQIGTFPRVQHDVEQKTVFEDLEVFEVTVPHSPEVLPAKDRVRGAHIGEEIAKQFDAVKSKLEAA